MTIEASVGEIMAIEKGLIVVASDTSSNLRQKTGTKPKHQNNIKNIATTTLPLKHHPHN